jgi:hypothetical protein
MAGGINAAIVPGLKCAGAANRITEGQETDQYSCSACGFGFLIDWYEGGPPETPCWPISEEEAERRRAEAALVFARLSNPPR